MKARIVFIIAFLYSKQIANNFIGKIRVKRVAAILFTLLFFSGAIYAFISGSGWQVYLAKLVGHGYANLNSSNKVISMQGYGVESLGGSRMAGAGYDMDESQDTIATKLADNLDNAHTYPNPFKPNSGVGHKNIIFTRLTDHTKLKIFTLAGELVYDIEIDTPMGELPWEVVNNSGQKVVSGVYFYLITDNNGHKKTGKLAVIR